MTGGKNQINEILSGSYNKQGIRDWWNRPRFQLDGKTPAQSWQDGDKQKVYSLALAGRA